MALHHIIEVESLEKVFHVGRVDVPALRGVDLRVEAGEFLAVIGPSGSGKSTLFHIIGGLTSPTAGRVLVDGVDLASVGDAGRTRLRKEKVGFVFQRFNLLPTLTAQGNIDVARHIAGDFSHYQEAHFQEIVKMLGIERRLHHRPAELSGGEQQRVATARALVNGPAILLADEPTGNLDTENSQAVLEVLRGLNQRLGQTILMITHNPEAAGFAHRTVAMRDGR
ncbi:MAG: ABC transporter ATP-binding protein, partial [Acidobacteria bacterium]|nr:ABC transporter ATP-binding protein [Acidobacteriota bacterium]